MGNRSSDARGPRGGPQLTGLTAAEVLERERAGQINITPRAGGRSIWDIVRANVFTWFNLILGVLFAAVLTFGSWEDGLFGSVMVINACIGIVQELRAKLALDRLAVLTAPTAKVKREGALRTIHVSDVVLDDIVQVTAGDQIVADGELLDSRDLEVDESLLTGESVPVAKERGDAVLSGSLVVAGSGVFRAAAVGAEAYAQRLTGEGRRYVRVRSHLVEGIDRILRVIGVGIVPVGAAVVWAQFRMGRDLEHGVTNTVAALVAMVPLGLVLLTSIAFAASAIALARRKVLASELPAVEGLARVDVLCIDKTGTITEPHPAFERFEPSRPGVDRAAALDALAAIAASASGRTSTLDAIADALPAPEGWTVEDTVSFSSARKWSAARFSGRGSWILGAPEIVAEGSREASEMASALAREGMRVLLLAHADAPLRGERLPEGLAPEGLVVFSERVREDAPKTIEYFRAQGVEIKVLSGDNPATVATIAGKAGVPGAERAVDARTLGEPSELADAMASHAVFGRVDPDQKRAMVEALQRLGHTVAMTGDGVNDVLALKKADVSVAMGTGTAAARAVSQLVLVDSRFETLPGVVAEGRRVTANIERVAHLFTTKSVWAALLAIAVAALTVPYPILPRQLTLIDALIIGIPGFFLALAPNPRRFVPGFVARVSRFVIPTGALAAIVMLVSFLALRRMGASLAETRTMETLVFCVIGWRVVAEVERPLFGWRRLLLAAMVGLLGLAFAIPFARMFFDLALPDEPVIYALTAAASALGWIFVGLGARVGRRLPLDEAEPAP